MARGTERKATQTGRRSEPATVRGVGAVPPWTPAEMDRRSRVTDSDLAKAANAWRRHADPGQRAILDAEAIRPRR